MSEDARVSAGMFAPGQAPRVSEQDIDAVIQKDEYLVLPDGRTTICMLTLRNGYTVRGESSCVCIENFDAAKGRDLAYKQARAKVWQLEGYLLAERLYRDSVLYAGN